MIILIDNYDSFTYNLYQLIASLGVEVMVFRNDAITVEKITTLQPKGIVLSPGPGRPEQAGICVELIQTLSGKIPILGVCLGHQAIAIAFGGRVEVHSEIVHGKPALVHHQGQGLYQQLPQPFSAGRYHSLVVLNDNFPNELVVDATLEDGTIMGMHHQRHPTYGIQFHPESILTPQGSCLFVPFLQQCTESL